MRRWFLAQVDHLCGKCSRKIAIGEWFMLVTRPEQAWRLVRCIDCAGEPAPTEAA